VNTGELVIAQGSFGTLPLSETMQIALPNEDKSFKLGQNHTFNAGASIYQPISQQLKIATGIAVAEKEVEMARLEKQKSSNQINAAVEKLYFASLINKHKQVELLAHIELAKIQLYDVKSALAAAKTVDASLYGLEANLADQEQDLIKLKIEGEDYISELALLTGLSIQQQDLMEIDPTVIQAQSEQEIQDEAIAGNLDIKLAELNKDKAELAEKAARQGNIPDLGVFAGYTYQKGNIIFPQSNPYIGISLKWNLQDIISNKSISAQRQLQIRQAEEQIAYKKEQVENDISKNYRQISQAKSLIQVAEKAVKFRREENRVQKDRLDAGLSKPADYLSAQASLAKSEADLYAALLHYKLVISDLKTIINK